MFLCIQWLWLKYSEEDYSATSTVRQYKLVAAEKSILILLPSSFSTLGHRYWQNSSGKDWCHHLWLEMYLSKQCAPFIWYPLVAFYSSKFHTREMEKGKGRRFLTYTQLLLKGLDFDVNQLSGYKPFLSRAFHLPYR